MPSDGLMGYGERLSRTGLGPALPLQFPHTGAEIALVNEMRQYMDDRMDRAEEHGPVTLAYWAGMAEIVGLAAHTSGTDEYQLAYERFLERRKGEVVRARAPRLTKGLGPR